MVPSCCCMVLNISTFHFRHVHISMNILVMKIETPRHHEAIWKLTHTHDFSGKGLSSYIKLIIYVSYVSDTIFNVSLNDNLIQLEKAFDNYETFYKQSINEKHSQGPCIFTPVRYNSKSKQSLFGSGKKKSSETMKKYPLFVIFWECFTIDGVVQIQDNWWL